MGSNGLTLMTLASERACMYAARMSGSDSTSTFAGSRRPRQGFPISDRALEWYAPAEREGLQPSLSFCFLLSRSASCRLSRSFRRVERRLCQRDTSKPSPPELVVVDLLPTSPPTPSPAPSAAPSPERS
eukprot:scaffold115_cov241-Pinguiococcus_pyrenoidosus.AAC.5